MVVHFYLLRPLSVARSSAVTPSPDHHERRKEKTKPRQGQGSKGGQLVNCHRNLLYPRVLKSPAEGGVASVGKQLKRNPHHFPSSQAITFFTSAGEKLERRKTCFGVLGL